MALGEAQHTEHGAKTDEGADDSEKLCQSSLRRSASRALIQDFGPFWFTWCMNSGILGLLTHQCPYQFKGLNIISTIFYVLDLVLFIIFSVIFLLRFAIFGWDAYNEIVSQQAELTLFACWPIAWMTLTGLTGLIDSNAYWGHAFTFVAYAMWWICVAWSITVMIWTFGTLIRRHEADNQRMPMLIILPAVSVSTAAVTGGLIVCKSHEMSPQLGVPIIVVSFMLTGAGILLGFMLSTYLFHSMLAKGWPAEPQTASVFVFIGPMGQSAAALQQLGIAARVYKQFDGYNRGNFLTDEAAVPLEIACVFVALLLMGLGVIWTILSVFVMIEKAVKKDLRWAPTWNSIVFPLGTLTTSTSLFAIEMDSPAFRVITAALIVVLIVVYLINVFMTIPRIWQGKLLIVREDWRVRKKLEGEQKGK